MKKYWRSIEEYSKVADTNKGKSLEPAPEFSVDGMDDHEIEGRSSRRDFLKMLGFSVGAATLAASCEMPVRKAIPYLNQPEEITPGIANYYASTFFDGHDYCSILVKTREGRPIKIEGNELSSITQGGTNARIQASVLNLYDENRLRNPMKGKNNATWEEVDGEIKAKLAELSGQNKKVVLLTSTIISPATKKIISQFIEMYPNVEWITYDAISLSAIREANKVSFGSAIIPSYRFDRADVIVGFNADFHGNWLSPTEFTKQYVIKRKLHGEEAVMSKHYHYETNMSLAGGNADIRRNIKPSEEATVLLNIYNKIAKNKGATTYSAPATKVEINDMVNDLLNTQGKSLLVSGTNDKNIQLIVNAINYLLGNYGNTIDLNHQIHLKQGIDSDMTNLLSEMENGSIGGLMMWNINPVYDYPEAERFKKGLKSVDLKVSFAESIDETADLCDYICPNNNYLESWDDAEPRKGFFSFTQPTIPKLFDTRQVQETLLKWMNIEDDYYTTIKLYWEENIFPLQSHEATFSDFWNKKLHDGIFENPGEENITFTFTESNLLPGNETEGGIEIVVYEKVSLGSGKYANNPWLQEMPDPISSASWDNYLCISTAYAKESGLKNEDVVMVDNLFEIPVLVQPGQTNGTASIALGYGREVSGKVAFKLGKNAYPLVGLSDGNRQYAGKIISIEKVEGKTYPLALTQVHNTMEGRPIVREASLEEYKANPEAGNEMHKLAQYQNATLYEQPQFKGFRWGMVVNLNACVGCSNCVISCQAENNVAVIGKEQIRNRRIMHWIRVDRYYSDIVENPEVVHQPVMCQHCDNAPCENVCPVAATPHSDEGLNQMAYNRCIGTRYCMNNCPYRVRRFNWFQFVNNDKFDYNMNNDLGKMVLNPDVTVRTRGVVEKCSLCVQRIQEKKLIAKKENRQLEDGEIKTACQQSCPADAIVFGNLLDPDSEVSKLTENPRAYQLLEQLHTLPSTSYLTRIRNKKS